MKEHRTTLVGPQELEVLHEDALRGIEKTPDPNHFDR